VARTVSMRASYASDSAFLIRFETAILKDTRRTEGWQREVRELLQRLKELLLLAERENLEAEASTERRGRRRGDASRVE
jgi:hypothetical protein